MEQLLSPWSEHSMCICPKENGWSQNKLTRAVNTGSVLRHRVLVLGGLVWSQELDLMTHGNPSPLRIFCVSMIWAAFFLTPCIGAIDENLRELGLLIVEKELREDLINLHNFLKGDYNEESLSLFSPLASNQTRGSNLKILQE